MLHYVDLGNHFLIPHKHFTNISRSHRIIQYIPSNPEFHVSSKKSLKWYYCMKSNNSLDHSSAIFCARFASWMVIYIRCIILRAANSTYRSSQVHLTSRCTRFRDLRWRNAGTWSRGCGYRWLRRWLAAAWLRCDRWWYRFRLGSNWRGFYS